MIFSLASSESMEAVAPHVYARKRTREEGN